MAVVGLSLKGGQLPRRDLRPGDHVAIVNTGAPQGGPTGGPSPAPTVVVADATVDAVAPSKTADDAAVVSVLVSDKDAPQVTRAEALHQVSLVLVPGR
jgi:hypothetical protein